LKAPASSVLFLLALVAFVSLGLPDTVLGVAWPSIRRTFGVPLDRLGLLLVATTTGYLVSSFLSGATVRRVGVGGLLVGSSVLVVTSASLYALSPWWPFVVLAALPAGLGAGAIDAGINAYAAARFPPGRVAWLHACWGIGATLGPLLMTGVLASGLSWRWGYGVLAVVLTALGLGFQRTRALWEAGETAGGGGGATIGDSLREPFLRANVVLFFVYTGLEAMAGQWAYSLFTEGRGISRDWAGVSVGAYWASLTLSRVVFGGLAHHVPPTLLLRASVAALPLLALLVAATRGPISGSIALALLGFAGGPVFPLLIAGTPERVGEAHSRNAVGFQVAAAGLGSAALPAAAGVLARAYGMEAISACLVATALVAFAVHESVLWRERLSPLLLPASLPEVLLSGETDNETTKSTED
jgi:fucose permease